MEPLAKDNGQTLSQHVEDCIRVARTIIPALSLPNEVKILLERDAILGLAFHDVGKAATGFQKMLKGEPRLVEPDPCK